MGLSPVFAQVLSDRREQFNARVAAARTRNPSFDIAAFTTFIEELGDPLLTKVLAKNESGSTQLVDAIFDTAIVLTEHRWVGTGARAQIVNRLWSEVLPQFANVIAGQPKATIAALTNATIKMSQEPDIDIEQWLTLVGSLGPKAFTLSEARNLIVVCTWRSGVAHMREVALAAASNLSPEVACAAIGADTDTDWQTIAGNFAAHQWWAPDRTAITQGHRIGTFAGFGGYFSEPPQLYVANDMFVAQSGGREFALFADAYGATLRPIDGPGGSKSVEKKQSVESRFKDQSIRADDRLVPLLMPAVGLCIAETSDSIAVSSRYSHSIQVLPKIMP